MNFRRLIIIGVIAGLLATGGIGLALAEDTVWQAVYESLVTEAVYQQDATPPEPPANLTGKDTKLGGQVKLRWELSTAEDLGGYNIYRSDASGGQVKVNSEPVVDNVFLDTGLENEMEYHYHVTAVDIAGNESSQSNQISLIPTLDITPPPVPVEISLRDMQTGKKIYLRWSAVEAGDLAGYYLYRRDNGEWGRVNSDPIPEVSMIDTSVINGTVYHYRVTSVDDVGNESAPSPEVRGWGTNQFAKIIWQYGETGQEGTSSGQLYAPYGISINKQGGIYVADTHNNRILEIDTEGRVLWSFANGLIEPTRARAISNGQLLITDSGGGRVIIVDRNNEDIVWSYGQGRRKHGRKPGQLNNPSDAVELANGNILIADTGNGRLLEVNKGGNVVWSTAKKGFGLKLDQPLSIQLLENGNFLITDAGLARTVEVDRKGSVYWSFGSGSGLDYPSESIRLKNGNTLIVDSMNYRILEVTQAGEVIWTYGQKSEQKDLFEPAAVAWLPDNHLLIADQHNHRIVRIDH